MPTLRLNRKEFENLVGKRLSEEKLKDRISMLGTDLEEVNDKEIIVEVFPDRPDMLSEQGFARAFSAFIDVKPGLRKYKVKNSGEKIIIKDSVKEIRPYTVCAIIKNLKFNDEKIKEIIQIQEKLHVTFGRKRKKLAIGIYPCEKIKFPVTYFAENPEKVKFRPLEYKNELNGLQILKLHPVGKEYAHLLEGCKQFPFFKDANNNILSMPPIINSYDTGRITEETKEIFIECSGFEWHNLNFCLNIIVTALADMGGEIYSLELDYKNKKEITPDLNPKEWNLNIGNVNRLLGLDLKKNKIKELLEFMGYDYKNNKVLVPAYRSDVIHEVDIIEDIAIAYGFENFKEEIPKVATIAEENPLQILKRKIADILIGHKLIETNSYNLADKEDMITRMNNKISCIELTNPVNQDYNVMRPWVLPSLIKILSENKHNEYPQNLFEMGDIFKKTENGTQIKEAIRLAIVLCHEKTNFTEIKQILDSLMNALDLSYTIEETKHNSFIEGRVGRISVKKKEIAYIGEIHPQVLVNFGLNYPVAALELNLTDLLNFCLESEPKPLK